MSTTSTPAYAEIASHCYPLGNTPPVCLTQDILPDEDARILLLGCGDARHVLFTAYYDNKFADGYRFDFLPVGVLQVLTAQLARNILLYTLLMDDKKGSDYIRIWDAYYHVRIDHETMELVHLQAKKLYQLAASTKNWEGSKYGKVIRFCDETTLQLVKGALNNMMVLDMNQAEREEYEKEFKDYLELSTHGGETERQNRIKAMLHISRSLGPGSFLFTRGFSLLSSHYWIHGSADQDDQTLATLKHFNPLFAFFTVGAARMNITSTPFSGFHLATHIILLSGVSSLGPESPFTAPPDARNLDAYKNVIGTMRRQFQSWSTAFRRCTNKGLTLRFFSGDAVAFCNTLEFKLKNSEASSANLYRSAYGFEPLNLDSRDYTYSGRNSQRAPLLFDVIDTSNLADHIGGINVLVAASPLLRRTMTSTIYTETTAKQARSYKELVHDTVCGDLPSIGALLGLFPVEYYANATATSRADEAMLVKALGKDGSSTQRVMYNRLVWKRQHTGSDRIHFHYADMVRLLEYIHGEMFRGEVPTRLFSDNTHETKRSHMAPVYTRASFAALIRWVQKTTTTDWEEVIPRLKKELLGDGLRPLNPAFQDEFNVQLHNFGVYSLILQPQEVQDSISSLNTAEFKGWKEMPPVMCVTLEIPRDRLDIFTGLFKQEPVAIPFQCILKMEDRTQQNYSVLQMSFGEIFTTGKRNSTDYEVKIIENDDGWDGDSPLLVSFYISTRYALRHLDTTRISLVVQHTLQTYSIFKEALGIEKTLYETSLGNEKNVFITVLPPGQLGRPTFHLASPSLQRTSRDPSLTLSAKLDPSIPKIVAYVRTIDSVHEEERYFLWSGGEVYRRQLSPCSIIFNTSPFDPGRYMDHFHRLRFPAPVSSTGKGCRIHRSSVRVEVDASIEKFSNGDGPAKFMFPIFLRHKKPVLMNMPYLDLAQLPIIAMNNLQMFEWLEPHISFQFSSRYRANTRSTRAPCTKDIRSGFKKTLYAIIMACAARNIETEPTIFTLMSSTSREVYFIVLVSCIRIDVANRTIVLDTAVLPRTKEVKEKYSNIAPHLEPIPIKVEPCQLTLWHYAFPAWVERCRVWKHTDACEYKSKDRVPLSIWKGWSPKSKSPFCSCGNGILPDDFVSEVPKWDLVSKYAVRAAISPCFAVEYVDPVFGPQDERDQVVYMDHVCLKCKAFRAKDGGPLSHCPHCSKAPYCSDACHKADWPAHRHECGKYGIFKKDGEQKEDGDCKKDGSGPDAAEK